MAAWRLNLGSAFHDGGRGASSGRARKVRRLLVVTQVAVAFVLLVGSGLLISSFRHVLAIDPGFDTTQVLTASVSLPVRRYVVQTPDPNVQDVGAIHRFADTAIAHLRATPGVVNAGFTSSIPLSGGTSTNPILAEGRPTPPGEPPMTAMRVHVTPGYLETLRVPLKAGRHFDARDTEQAPPVVIVDTRLAERLWPGQDPIGRRMAQERDLASGRDWQTVVGVVGEVSQIALVADRPVGGVYYYPMAQNPSLGMTVAVRTAGDPAAMANALRKAVAAADPALPLYRLRTFEQVADDSLLTRRWPMLVITAFGAVALLLAAVGLYGVLAYLVTQRTREIGVRMALGGTPRAIFNLVAREGLVLMTAGVAAGAVGVVTLKRTMASQLYGVQAGDPRVLAAATLVLGLIAFLACAIPARRATKVDPILALRNE
ncbi:MAG TPA: FtsX-like permease family protein [Vicinamibacterales bacterium]|nr:FtsX-like permease family protein [Vicinamibacterales bacterium]